MHLGIAVNLWQGESAAEEAIIAINGGRSNRCERIRVQRGKADCRKEMMRLPDVLVSKKRAFVRFARPSMLRVPWNDVLIVLTALNW